jgi:hypothetical protein
MTLWFHLIAARSVLRRQPRAVVRMALTSMVATLWCLVGGIWAVASWRETQAMASETLMELFVPAEAAPASDATCDAFDRHGQGYRRRSNAPLVPEGCRY